MWRAKAQSANQSPENCYESFWVAVNYAGINTNCDLNSASLPFVETDTVVDFPKHIKPLSDMNSSNVTGVSITTNPYALAAMQFTTVYWVFYNIIAIITIIGNSLAVYILISRPYLLHQTSPNGRFFLSLAVSDLLVGIFPFLSVQICVFGTPCNSTIWAVIAFLVKVVINSSVTSLCLLTMDRYWAVVHPFSHITMEGHISTLISIAVAWIVPPILELPFLLKMLGFYTNKTLFGYRIVYEVITTCLPIIFMVYAYTRIILVVRKHRREIRAQNDLTTSATIHSGEQLSQDHSAPPRRNRHKDLTAIGIVVAIFLVCNIFSLFWMSCVFLIASCRPAGWLTDTTALVRYLNSAPNFYVYAVMKTDFRREVKTLFRHS
ncbi:predicted protein [Nematostella vectensis]|uniref:G-protein coupled receptors family 1 profile domain-containing protein n=1 Tax=Nematostella vectensis TaxID=45351 RepID=A7RIA3_NEMVE|nr:predicted protein [Nematostella vectensis]|eukprot:XP_001640729.1 predicted protein [Nematostella vectensis]